MVVLLRIGADHHKVRAEKPCELQSGFSGPAHVVHTTDMQPPEFVPLSLFLPNVSLNLSINFIDLTSD